jgi:hypothetical protein
MRIKFNRSYKKLNKNNQPVTVFVYVVTGTEEQLQHYKETQGDNFRESDSGDPLWFTTRFAGNQTSLIITSTGKLIADMSAFDQAESLAKQFGGNLGAELAKISASQLLGTPVAMPEQQRLVAPVEPESSEQQGSEPDKL